jgi:hypothetical protein
VTLCGNECPLPGSPFVMPAQPGVRELGSAPGRPSFVVPAKKREPRDFSHLPVGPRLRARATTHPARNPAANPLSALQAGLSGENRGTIFRRFADVRDNLISSCPALCRASTPSLLAPKDVGAHGTSPAKTKNKAAIQSSRSPPVFPGQFCARRGGFGWRREGEASGFPSPPLGAERVRVRWGIRRRRAASRCERPSSTNRPDGSVPGP